MTSDTLNVLRLLLFDVSPGDRRKFEARSNDSPSGGGARDLRLRPEAELLPFLRDLFPHRQTILRKRKGIDTEIEVLSGTVIWKDGEVERRRTLDVWPSTDSRPDEMRIARVSELGVEGLIEDDPNGGRSILMVFQQRDSTIRLHFTTETSLREADWHPAVKRFAFHWLDSDAKTGYVDFLSQRRYPE